MICRGNDRLRNNKAQKAHEKDILLGVYIVWQAALAIKRVAHGIRTAPDYLRESPSCICGKTLSCLPCPEAGNARRDGMRSRPVRASSVTLSQKAAGV
jgi:hypothetical protein